MSNKQITKITTEELKRLSFRQRIEIHENMQRLGFCPSEMVRVGERELRPAFEAAARERQGERTDLEHSGNLPEGPGRTRDKLGAVFGVGGKTYEKAHKVVEAVEAEPALLEGIVPEMDETLNVDAAYKEVKKRLRQADLDRQRAEIAEQPQEEWEGLFDVIVIDPPWPYGTKYDPDGRRAANPYPEMSLEEIMGIELPANDDCVLWLWTTHKFMRDSFAILDGWAFREVAIVTWVKGQMGLGAWLRSQSEFCIMAVKGKPKVELTNQTTVVHGELREHSRKPDEFYEMVEGLCLGHKLDYFSRAGRPGWVQFGNDPGRFDNELGR